MHTDHKHCKIASLAGYVRTGRRRHRLLHGRSRSGRLLRLQKEKKIRQRIEWEDGTNRCRGSREGLGGQRLGRDARKGLRLLRGRRGLGLLFVVSLKSHAKPHVAVVVAAAYQRGRRGGLGVAEEVDVEVVALVAREEVRVRRGEVHDRIEAEDDRQLRVIHEVRSHAAEPQHHALRER